MLFLFFLFLLLFPSFALAEQKHPQEAKIGAILVHLGDFNYKEGTFTAAFWIWSLSDKPADNAILSFEFPNLVGKAIIDGEDASRKIPDGYLGQKRIYGTFRHHWNMKNFPFDKQRLEILFEENEKDTRSLVYSTYKDDIFANYDKEGIKLAGWDIENVRMVTSEKEYKTDFGDTTRDIVKTPNKFARLAIEMDIKRTDTGAFWRFSAAAFIALAMAFITYFLAKPTAIAPRMGLLAGSVFAVVINMGTVSNYLGTANELTLMDTIHVCVLAYIIVATFTAVYNWWHSTREKVTKDPEAVSLRMAIISTILFFITVAGLLLKAVFGGSIL